MVGGRRGCPSIDDARLAFVLVLSRRPVARSVECPNGVQPEPVASITVPAVDQQHRRVPADYLTSVDATCAGRSPNCGAWAAPLAPTIRGN